VPSFLPLIRLGGWENTLEWVRKTPMKKPQKFYFYGFLSKPDQPG
jgi:hypothetical protein